MVKKRSYGCSFDGLCAPDPVLQEVPLQLPIRQVNVRQYRDGHL